MGIFIVKYINFSYQENRKRLRSIIHSIPLRALCDGGYVLYAVFSFQRVFFRWPTPFFRLLTDAAAIPTNAASSFELSARSKFS